LVGTNLERVREAYFGLGRGQLSALFEPLSEEVEWVVHLPAQAGPGVRVDGVDPTAAFIELARTRAARLGAAAGYEVGDIRGLPYPDGAFDGAFCEKVLLHVGPARAALWELVRVTRPGGRVGAVEWCPFFGLSARAELAAPFNDGLRRAVYDYWVGPNLARHFAAAGLVEVETFLYVGQARSLGAHPFWRAFLLEQLPLFAHAGLISEAAAGELAAGPLLGQLYGLCGGGDPAGGLKL